MTRKCISGCPFIELRKVFSFRSLDCQKMYFQEDLNINKNVKFDFKFAKYLIFKDNKYHWALSSVLEQEGSALEKLTRSHNITVHSSAVDRQLFQTMITRGIWYQLLVIKFYQNQPITFKRLS